jgi:hypothetical protein
VQPHDPFVHYRARIEAAASDRQALADIHLELQLASDLEHEEEHALQAHISELLEGTGGWGDLLPAALEPCPYCGKVRDRRPGGRVSNCLCAGIPCRRCHAGRVHRPVPGGARRRGVARPRANRRRAARNPALCLGRSAPATQPRRAARRRRTVARASARRAAGRQAAVRRPVARGIDICRTDPAIAHSGVALPMAGRRARPSAWRAAGPLAPAAQPGDRDPLVEPARLAQHYVVTTRALSSGP